LWVLPKETIPGSISDRPPYNPGGRAAMGYFPAFDLVENQVAAAGQFAQAMPATSRRTSTRLSRQRLGERNQLLADFQRNVFARPAANRTVFQRPLLHLVDFNKGHS
jgi:hypothetical protein